MSDERSLWALADLVTPMAIRVAATLRLADHIIAGTRTPEALAEAVQADPDALRRLLEHLATAGLVTRTGDGFALSPLGEQLRGDHPDQFRDWLDLEGSIGRSDLAFTGLLHTVRTGEAAFPRHFGRPFWEDLAADAARQASFDNLMGGRLTRDLPAVATAYPWGAAGHVVDVGGGDGSLLLAILAAHPGVRGTVVELPGAAAKAEAAIAAAGLADRAAVRTGSFFDEGVLPAGAGAYVLSGVLHNWSDADATRLLRRCADAAGPGGVVLVADHIGDDYNTEGDLRMLTYFKGCERNLDRLRQVAAAAGLTVGDLLPAGSRSLLELRSAA
ncbi:methyltransferase [Dactylosporangium matsuzakiense]|uniref:Methyltransferase n=1 Tax=Dactylosporangium matsuzakiense TaxID=53360 RepID=A0A9W6KLH4_9ACTN|nr:methyltransferase [Dactylosporangium matsuzakiense]GLL03187.1 methyltransferase [Dactylosporangium matsuzakiense]